MWFQIKYYWTPVNWYRCTASQWSNISHFVFRYDSCPSLLYNPRGNPRFPYGCCLLLGFFLFWPPLWLLCGELLTFWAQFVLFYELIPSRVRYQAMLLYQTVLIVQYGPGSQFRALMWYISGALLFYSLGHRQQTTITHSFHLNCTQ